MQCWHRVNCYIWCTLLCYGGDLRHNSSSQQPLPTSFLPLRRPCPSSSRLYTALGPGLAPSLPIPQLQPLTLMRICWTTAWMKPGPDCDSTLPGSEHPAMLCCGRQLGWLPRHLTVGQIEPAPEREVCSPPLLSSPCPSPTLLCLEVSPGCRPSSPESGAWSRTTAPT